MALIIFTLAFLVGWLTVMVLQIWSFSALSLGDIQAAEKMLGLTAVDLVLILAWALVAAHVANLFASVICSIIGLVVGLTIGVYRILKTE